MTDLDGGVLAGIDRWGASFAAAAVLRGDEVLGRHGDTRRAVRTASVTKLATAWAVLLAVEEGAVGLDEPLGPPGSTIRHLLAHASGLDFDTDRVLAPAGTRRIYSNTGYELLAAHVASRTGLAFGHYLAEGVLGPLGMVSSRLEGSPARDLVADVEDLLRLAGELRRPHLLDASTASEAVTCQFPGLAGVLPGWGRQDPCDWGLGPELRGTKTPHWTGATAAPSTFGHFGGAGTFLWVDPAADLCCVVLTDRAFGPWAVQAWPAFSDAVRAAYP